MSQRNGVRGDGLVITQRPRSGVVVAAPAYRLPAVIPSRTRGTWEFDVDIDVLPRPQDKPDRNMPPKR